MTLRTNWRFMRVMRRALRAEPTAASGVAAAVLAYRVVSGGERIILEISERMKDELFHALDAANLTDEQLDLIESALRRNETRVVH